MTISDFMVGQEAVRSFITQKGTHKTRKLHQPLLLGKLHFPSRLPKELCHLSFFPRSQWPGQPTWLLGARGMVRGPPSARGLHSDQQVPGQVVCSPAGEDALAEQVTLKCSDWQCMAWDMQLGSMDVISQTPAHLCGAELSPCLLGSFIFPAEDPQSGTKMFVKTWLSKNSTVVFVGRLYVVILCLFALLGLLPLQCCSLAWELHAVQIPPGKIHGH